jgi:hypothetical protein
MSAPLSRGSFLRRALGIGAAMTLPLDLSKVAAGAAPAAAAAPGAGKNALLCSTAPSLTVSHYIEAWTVPNGS